MRLPEKNDSVFTNNLIETIAWKLNPSDQDEVAFLVDGPIVYHARAPKILTKTPFSPVTRLIQGIYENYSSHARKIVRNRIYSTQTSPTEMCFGMVKVAAKRMTYGVLPTDHKVLLPFDFVDLTYWDRSFSYDRFDFTEYGKFTDVLTTDAEFIHSTFEIARSIPTQSLRYQSPRPVAAILVVDDPLIKKSQILELAVNTNSENRTLHAEVNLVQNYYRRTKNLLPKFSKIYTSLKCCKMCASMIWHSSEDVSTINVYYGKDDPGPNAKSTVFTPQSFERLRAACNLKERDLILEHQVP